jgi:hypothetical protein
MPPRLGPRLRRALGILSDSVARRDSVRARRAALNLADAALDVELRTRPPEEIDRARFELWARKLVVDASAGDAAGVRGDLATLEWIRDRIAQTFDKVALTRIDAHAAVLRTRINDEDLPAAAAEATRLLGTLHDV